MGSKYPKSVRLCLPLGALVLEVAFILTFTFTTSYDNFTNNQKFWSTYAVLQDVTVMAAIGLGFLNSSLRRHGWSSVAFNFFLLALGVQWGVLLDGFLNKSFRGKMTIKLSSIQEATMSAMSVLISAGAVLGRANLVQLMVMALVEVTTFGAMRWICKQMLIFECSGWVLIGVGMVGKFSTDIASLGYMHDLLHAVLVLPLLGQGISQMEEHVSMMLIHVFAAYFGITVARCLSGARPQEEKTRAQAEKVQMATSPSLFAMLGALFLWMFWTSFNSALVDEASRKKAVFNTYYALAVSTVTATSASALGHHQGKINMTHIHNAVLAGGVAVGASCHLISSPWIAMVLGFMAGLISIGAAKCLMVCLNRTQAPEDHSGVHYTFGLPGLLGGLAYTALRLFDPGRSLTVGDQLLYDTGALSLALAMGLVSGLLTGLLLKLKIWKSPHVVKYFDDQTFWEFPHLAVGF